MRCPHCAHPDVYVLDSRPVESAGVIRTAHHGALGLLDGCNRPHYPDRDLLPLEDGSLLDVELNEDIDVGPPRLLDTRWIETARAHCFSLAHPLGVEDRLCLTGSDQARDRAPCD